MLVNYFSPLAPAVTLLLGALILFGISPRQFFYRRPLLVFLAPIIVGVGVLVLLTTRLTLGVDAGGIGLQILSGWDFFSAQSGATLAVRLDLLSLLFIIPISLILFAVILRRSVILWNGGDVSFSDVSTQQVQMAAWLILTVGAALLFVAANGLTLSYTLVIFDALTAFYWWNRRRIDFGLACLFLAFVTVTGLVLQSVGAVQGQTVFYGALWLRLGLYPLWGWRNNEGDSQTDYFIYLLFSVAAGIYLLFRTTAPAVPAALFWLILFTMVVAGIWGWLTATRQRWLISIIVVEGLALLLVHTLNPQIATAYMIGGLLSVTALWHIPGLGKPNFSERAWLWPYLPALGATVTLLGLPQTLVGPVRSAMYSALTGSANVALLLTIALSEALVLSGLVGFWREIWHEKDTPRLGYSVAGIVVMVPFLIPGLGTFIFASFTGAAFAPNFSASNWLTGWGALVMAMALPLGYFAPSIKTWLEPVVGAIIPVSTLSLDDGLLWLENKFSRLGKIVLRIEAWLEGQHYLGWALLVAIIGLIIFFLGT